MTGPIPAATLVLFRSCGDRVPELLMIERAGGMAFAGGARVFPGGRVNPGDHALAADAPDPEDAAARIAAIRETIEEAGVALGLTPAPDAETVAAIRAGLATRPFGDVLATHGLKIDLAALVPFARWCPAFDEARNFDTRFYLAEAPAACEATADGGESVGIEWTTAAAALAAADAGITRLIFPTRRNLERLARFASFAAAVSDTRDHPVTTITPRVEGDALCIPEGLGYPVTREPLAAARRY